MEIAKTILEQMGGDNRIALMIGVKGSFMGLENGVSFKFKAKAKDGINYCKITLNGLDLYDIEFGRVHGINYTVKKTFDDIYCDQLIKTFEGATGLYLHL